MKEFFFTREFIRKSLKSYKCNCCNERIEKGSSYLKGKKATENENDPFFPTWVVTRYHIDCDEFPVLEYQKWLDECEIS
jgi:hypothetical protein